MPEKVSVICSTTDILKPPPPLPPGADELVLIAGYGPRARNAAAKIAAFPILVFTDDSIRLTGSLVSIGRAGPEEGWWTLHGFEPQTTDPHLASMCAGASICSACHLPTGSVAPFQAVRRSIFNFIGGYHDVPDYGGNLAYRLDLAGARLFRTKAVGYVLRPWDVPGPGPLRGNSHRVIPAYLAERDFAATL